jgi:hypothetical protein
MATFDSGRQRYSMNFYASHQRPLQHLRNRRLLGEEFGHPFFEVCAGQPTEA